MAVVQVGVGSGLDQSYGLVTNGEKGKTSGR